MPDALTILTRSEEETRQAAARVAALLGPGDIVALVGDLGTGKTRFVKGACRALGYAGRVRSPSYTLLNIYRARCPVYHFDLYRWDPAGGDRELGEWEEWMTGDGISFIEWADRLEGNLPGEALVVTLRHAGGSRRRLEFAVAGSSATRWQGRLGSLARLFRHGTSRGRADGGDGASSGSGTGEGPGRRLRR